MIQTYGQDVRTVAEDVLHECRVRRLSNPVARTPLAEDGGGVRRGVYVDPSSRTPVYRGWLTSPRETIWDNPRETHSVNPRSLLGRTHNGSRAMTPLPSHSAAAHYGTADTPVSTPASNTSRGNVIHPHCLSLLSAYKDLESQYRDISTPPRTMLLPASRSGGEKESKFMKAAATFLAESAKLDPNNMSLTTEALSSTNTTPKVRTLVVGSASQQLRSPYRPGTPAENASYQLENTSSSDSYALLDRLFPVRRVINTTDSADEIHRRFKTVRLRSNDRVFNQKYRYI